MTHVILFDLNGTLLDMSALDPHFARAFGAASARERWFKELEGLMLTTIATDTYQDFSKLAEAALKMLARKDGVDLSARDRTTIEEALMGLPPYPDVVTGLTQLRDGGQRLAVLTNGTSKAARRQLKAAGLTEYFEEALSVDEVERFKPAPEPYRMATKRLGVEPGAVLMVAAHAWDVAGAHAVGLQTAFLARPRQVLNPAGPNPDFEAATLTDLADRVLGRKTG